MILVTIAVRDEADIIAANLEHHLGAGVDRIVVLDNGSTDGTTDILDTYVRAGVAEVTRDDSADFEVENAMNRLVCGAVARHRPDWLIPADADEFYVAPDGNLRDALAAHGDDRVLTCARDNLVGSLQAMVSEGWQHALRHVCTSELTPPPGHHDPGLPLSLPYFCFRLPPKVIFRPEGLVRVHPGAHHVELSEPVDPRPTVIRTRHFPVRTAAEFLRSVRRFAATLPPDLPGRQRISGKYRRWGAMLALPDGEARVLAEVLPDAAQLAAGLADGTYAAIHTGLDLPALNAAASMRRGGTGTAALEQR